MSWRQFKTDSGGFKGFKGFKPPDAPPLKPLKPLKPVGEILENNIVQPFVEGQWRRKIQAALDTAIAEDRGALNWCHQNRPDLYRRCTGAFMAVDSAFEERDPEKVETALRNFAEACRATISAMDTAA